MTGTPQQQVQPLPPVQQPVPQPLPVVPPTPSPLPVPPPPPLEPMAAGPKRYSDPNEGRKKSIKGPLLLMVVVLALFAGLGFLFYKLFFENQLNNALSCSYNGTTYKDGEAFLSTDQCNSCGCTGGIISCTTIECNATTTPTPDATGSGIPGDFSSGQYKIYLYACNNNNPGAVWTFEVDGVLAASTTSQDTTGGLTSKNCRLKTIRTDKQTMTIKVTRDEDGVVKTQEKQVDASVKPYVYFNYKENDITIEDYDRELELVDAS